MTSRLWLAGLAASGIFATTLGAQRPLLPTPPPPRTAMLMGVIVDSVNDLPVHNALVSIGGDRVLTDADGRFVFTELAGGPYSIVAEKPGYLDGAYGRTRPGGPPQALNLAADDRLTEIRIAIWRLAAVSGAVTDEAGDPVVNARVDVLSRSTRDGKVVLSRAASGFTDDRGFYRVGSLQPGEHIVAAVGPELPVTPALGPLVFPAEYYPGVQSITQAAPVSLNAGDDRAGVDFRIRAGAAVRVSGMIVGPDGFGLAATLKLFVAGTDIAGATGFEVASTSSAKTGQFGFQAVPAGDYVLRASYEPPAVTTDQKEWPRPLWAMLPVSVGNREVRDLRIVMQQGFRVTGRFESDTSGRRGGPNVFRGLSGQVLPIDGTNVAQPFTSDSSGRFTVSDLPPGRYVVRLGRLPEGMTLKRIAQGGRDVSHLGLNVSRDIFDLTVTLTDRPAEVSGTVRGRSGNPDATATVLIFPAAREAWSNFGNAPLGIRALRAARDGWYRFSELPPGEYFVVAVPDAEGAGILDVATLEAASRAGVRVTIADGENRYLDLKTSVLVR